MWTRRDIVLKEWTGCVSRTAVAGIGALLFMAFAGGVVKGTAYVDSHPYTGTQEWWAGMGKAVMTGQITYAAYAVGPTGAAVGSGIGLLNGLLTGDIPKDFDENDPQHWYALLDSATGPNTAIGVPGHATAYGVVFDAPAADAVLMSIDYTATWWTSMNIRQKALTVISGLLMSSAIRPSNGTTPTTKAGGGNTSGQTGVEAASAK